MKVIFCLLTIILSVQAFADYRNLEIIKYSHADDYNVLKDFIEGSSLLRRDTMFVFEKKMNKSRSRYVNGDYVILWGVGSSRKDQKITQDEYEEMWSLMNYFSSKDFRVIMNTRADSEHLKEALKSKTTSVILFSAHGNEDAFYDYNQAAVPFDILTNKAPNVYQFILSACYGILALKNYKIPRNLHIISWEGLTDSTQLHNFLVSDEYTGFEGKK